VVEGDDVDFERHPGHFLGLDALDGAHAVRGIDDVIADREFQTALAHVRPHQCGPFRPGKPSFLIRQSATAPSAKSRRGAKPGQDLE
jgi:hypothetical protein